MAIRYNIKIQSKRCILYQETNCLHNNFNIENMYCKWQLNVIYIIIKIDVHSATKIDCTFNLHCTLMIYQFHLDCSTLSEIFVRKCRGNYIVFKWFNWAILKSRLFKISPIFTGQHNTYVLINSPRDICQWHFWQAAIFPVHSSL